MYIGEYSDDFKQKNHPLNNKIEEVLADYTYRLDELKFYRFSDKSNEIKYSIIWIIISIAEINKKNLGSEISIDEFLTYGIKVLNNEISLQNLDEYDDLKLYSLKKILNEINENKYIRRLISKDATASCFQHLIKILGYSEEDSLKWCNLKSFTKWFDTYMRILEQWFKSIEKDISDDDMLILRKYFKRASIKKVTMTQQYGAGFFTCWDYFKREINLEKKDEDLVKFYFKNYYKFISGDIGLLDNSSRKIIDSLKNSDYKVILDDSTIVDLKYYHIKIKQNEIRHNKKRFTKQEIILDVRPNIKKIKSSSTANYIHAHDSAVIRDVISITPVLTVHDCFLIDYRSTTFLISLVNDAMRKKFHDLKISDKFKENEIFSMFIVI